MPNSNQRPRKKITEENKPEENKVELLAEEIYNKTMSQIDKSELHGIDPLTIIIIIGIIVNIIRVIQECNKDKVSKLAKSERTELLSTDMKFRAFQHGWLTRLKLKRIVKKYLTKDQYKEYGEPILKSLLDVGKTVKEEQVSALLEYENV
jgi:hypothetical protein